VRRRNAAVSTIAMFMILSASPGTAHADSIPFSDPDANGFVAFCDGNDNPITSGPLDSHPFVVKAIASVAAPSVYGPQAGGKATLYAYQPRKGLDPGEWSNSQLTGSSRYSNQDLPMSDGTVLDPSMADQLEAYPAEWDNLVQIRMLLSAPNVQPRLRPYAASVIRIVGDRWQMVEPQTLPCKEGKAVSLQRDLLPASTFTPKPSSSPAPSGYAAGSGSSSKTSTRSGAAPSTSASSSGLPDATSSSTSAAASTTASASQDSSNGSTLGVVLGILALVAAAGGGAWWWRTRRS